MANHIALKGDFIRKEAIASGTILPGHLVDFGGSQELSVHSEAGGHARRAFALKNDLIGRGRDDAYQEGEVAQYGVFPPGAEVNALLKSGENVTVGTRLVSAGDGTLQAWESGGDLGAIVAIALEDLNNNTGSAARLIVEVA